MKLTDKQYLPKSHYFPKTVKFALQLSASFYSYQLTRVCLQILGSGNVLNDTFSIHWVKEEEIF